MRVAIFACLDTDSFSARCQNRKKRSLLTIYTAAYERVIVMLVAGLALRYGEINKLT